MRRGNVRDADVRFGTAEWKCRRSACCRSAGGNVSGWSRLPQRRRACASGATQAASEPALPEPGPRIGFATRCAGKSSERRRFGSARAGGDNDSYAERHETTNAAAQMPSKWPGVDGDRARAASAGETALRYFTVAGMLAIPLLLVAGWGARFARRPRRSLIRDRWRTLAERLRPRRHVDFTEMAGIKPADETRRDDIDRRMPMPTDPAADLKTGLAELMRDLRRAGRSSRFSRRRGRPIERTQKSIVRPWKQRSDGGAWVARICPGYFPSSPCPSRMRNSKKRGTARISRYSTGAFFCRNRCARSAAAASRPRSSIATPRSARPKWRRPTALPP